MAGTEHLVQRQAQIALDIAAIKERLQGGTLPHWEYEKLNKKREKLKEEHAALTASLTTARDQRRIEIAEKVSHRADRLAFTLGKINALRDLYVSYNKDPARTEAVRFVYGEVVKDLNRVLGEIAEDSRLNALDEGQANPAVLTQIRAALNTPRKKMVFESAHEMGRQAGSTSRVVDDAAANAEWNRLRKEMPEIVAGWIKDIGEMMARSAFVGGFKKVPLPRL